MSYHRAAGDIRSALTPEDARDELYAMHFTISHYPRY